MPRSTVWFFRLLVCASLAVVALGAQQPTFRAAAELVQLDVSVLDKAGKPVRGLTRSDFTVLEDGKLQPIVAFTPVDIPDPAPPLPEAMAWTQKVAPDVRTNAIPPDGRLFVLMLDDALLPPDPRMIEDAKKAARSVVNHLSPEDQMAVVFSENGHASQSFTSDHARLLAAIDALKAGRASYAMGWDTAPPISLTCDDVQARESGFKCSPTMVYHSLNDLHPVMDSDAAVREASVTTLTGVADALTSAAKRRKALVYIGPGVPVNVGDTAPYMAGTGHNGMVGQSPIDHDMNVRLGEEMQSMFRELQRANITVYTIDPTGLNGFEAYMQAHLQSIEAFRWPQTSPLDLAGKPQPGNVPTTMDLAHFVGNLDMDFLETAAANTGGRAIVNTNDVDAGIDAIFRENGSYYSIGYQATDPGSGHMHRLSVKVSRADLEVRTRSGYYATDAEAMRKEDKASPIVKAIAGVLPTTDLPMDVTLAPFMTQGKNGPTGTVAIVLGMIQYAPATAMAIAVDLQTNAYTEDGDPRGSSAQHARVRLFAGGPQDVAHYEVLSRIDLKPGRYQLRLGAFNHSNDKSGSVFADVDVPDFAKAPLSLSGVLLEASPSLPAAPKDALAALGPIVPTAQREFDARDRVSAFFNIYEAAGGTPAPVVLTTYVVDEKGAPIFDHVETVEADSFGAARAVDKHVALPLAGRTRGEYLLTIEAISGKTTVTRAVRFSVK